MTRSLRKSKYFDDIIDGSSIQIHFNSLKWIPIRIPCNLRCFLLLLSDFLHDQHPPVHFLGNFEIGQVYCLCITVLCEVVFYISKRDLNSALNKFLLFPLYLCDASVSFKGDVFWCSFFALWFFLSWWQFFHFHFFVWIEGKFFIIYSEGGNESLGCFL